MSLPATLQLLRVRHQNKIDVIDDERDTDDGYWLYLKRGWQFDGAHLIHEYTVSALCKTFNNRVTPCNCLLCKEGVG